jgi:hypothetical protein
VGFHNVYTQVLGHAPFIIISEPTRLRRVGHRSAICDRLNFQPLFLSEFLSQHLGDGGRDETGDFAAVFGYVFDNGRR